MTKTNTHHGAFAPMLESPIPLLIARLAVPTIISMLVTAIYNMADTFFVSQLGTSASGAVGIVFSLMAIIQAVGFTLGMGSASLVSRSLGADKGDEANHIASVAFFSAMAIGILMAVGGIFFSDTLMEALGSTPTILPYAQAYGHYILLGAPLMCSSFVLNNLLRSQGRAALSMMGLTAGGILNIILDPVFIFVFDLGIAGAAIATLISQAISFLILLSMFLFKKSVVSLHLSLFFTSWKTWFFSIFKNGMPSLSRQGLASVATVALNVQAGAYGDAAVAGMSITGRIFMFVLSVMIGLGQGFQPVAGFCYGAKRYDRVKKGFIFTLILGFVLLTLAAFALFFGAPALIRLFRDDPLVIEVGTNAVRYQSVALPLLSLIMTGNMLLQSTGHAHQATFLSMCRQGVFFLPLILVLPPLWGLTGVEIVQPVSDIFSAVTAVPFVVAFFKKVKKLETEIELLNG